MFDMSWGEVMLIGGVALVVIGPKDLPRTLRTVGQVVARVKRMAGEFQSQFSEAMREAELDDVRREVADINRSVSSATSTGFNPVQTIRNEIKGAVDGVPKPATQALPGAESSASDPSAPHSTASDVPAALPEPAPPAFDPAAPPAYQLPEPADEKPSISALAAATAQLKAEAARAASKSPTSHDTASTGHTA
ncbi:Sec-independent protein translocase protein TatB [Methylobacterium sp. SyP6R]|uniref:Sec-independent protein translocase protein TatB n=1 Tax=Methylobacterium sp. SyP6R TaxID=2718876 RepID=UPI001F00D4CF|nr:Sec-independent protein translocase protein TatB [Methylobacterium sp. SyP6R]MCF4125558.1 Sec-independent protein translocase protein TatB [Methylobacterium sp. SyP6R]